MHSEIDLIRDTIDILNRNGWTRGSYQSEEGAYCVSGALHAAAVQRDPLGGSEKWYSLLKDVSAKLISAGMPYSGSEPAGIVPHWNDRIVKDKDDAIKTLRRLYGIA